MDRAILSVEIRSEPDVVLTRQRARQIASALGFESQDQTRIATAVSEIVRNAFRYAGGGRAEFRLQEKPEPMLLVQVRDRGRGIGDLQAVLDGRYRSATGMGMGIVGAKRLSDRFSIESAPDTGTTVLLGKRLPKARPLTERTAARVAEELSNRGRVSDFEELQEQNQELIRTMEELQRRQSEVERLNRELEETNRGVLALYAELDDKAEALRTASELKSRFMSNMTHELRTPLNSIIMVSRLLLEGVEGPLTAQQDRPVLLVRQAAEGLLELVNDLLDLAKIEAGKTDVRVSAFTVSDVFGALRGMFRPLLTDRENLQLVFETPDGVPTLRTDEGKVAQILRNFISNAVKFTERGEVRVRAGVDEAGLVVFTVSDTGVGIAAEDQTRLFQEYSQLDHDAVGPVKGTGLGLSITRRLSALLGGKVFVHSEPGKGSTFGAAVPPEYSAPTNSPTEEAGLPAEARHA